ncbi:MAG: hypothetical protein H6711_21170 [Myxococcales bacterium]|nr:hypothetical protein [Myxococcales bacterium]
MIAGADVLEAAEEEGRAAVVGRERGVAEERVEALGRGGVVVALALEDRLAPGTAGEPEVAVGLGDRLGVGGGVPSSVAGGGGSSAAV